MSLSIVTSLVACDEPDSSRSSFTKLLPNSLSSVSASSSENARRDSPGFFRPRRITRSRTLSRFGWLEILPSCEPSDTARTAFPSLNAGTAAPARPTSLLRNATMPCTSSTRVNGKSECWLRRNWCSSSPRCSVLRTSTYSELSSSTTHRSRSSKRMPTAGRKGWRRLFMESRYCLLPSLKRSCSAARVTFDAAVTCRSFNTSSLKMMCRMWAPAKLLVARKRAATSSQ
mmetsp:Transcript_21787/g.54803  ORF Transcript_21787/g.54803 Transcript_21787/m.54803 type:complete len:229 (+) Transcript_21787:1016-1702(+)